MKAAVQVGPRAIQLRQLPDPAPLPDGLVLAMKACGVCGSDLRRWAEGPSPGTDPLVQGHELAGEVVGPWGRP